MADEVIAPVRPISFERFAGAASFLVAAGALAYSLVFIAIVEGAGRGVRELWFGLLLIGGLATIPVLVAVYQRLRLLDPGFALTALLLALGGAFGGIFHGAYSLGVSVTPRGAFVGPEQASHGILRYGIAGLAFLLIAWLIHRGAPLPRGLAYLGYAGGAILVFIYFGRLYDFITPGDYATLIPPIVYGFIIHPLWYGWLGLALWRGASR
jgi:hypothetical protein